MKCEDCKYFRGYEKVFTGMCCKKESEKEHGDFGHGLKTWFEGKSILPSKTNRKNCCGEFKPKEKS